MNKLIINYKKLTILGKISLFIILTLFLLGIFSSQIANFPPDKVVADAFISPNKTHYLGTDDLGMDIFAQILYGAKVSIFISLVVAISSTVLGSIVGMLAGYYGGIIDRILIRIIDILTIIPTLPLLIIISAFWGPSIKNIIVILIFLSWINPARMIRSKVITLKTQPYIIASKYYGAGFMYIARKHFFKEVFPLMLVSIIKLISATIVSEASLSFLGLGDPTNKTWGLVLNYALSFNAIYFTPYWKWWVLSPLMAIMILVLSVSFFSMELERLLNTKL